MSKRMVFILYFGIIGDVYNFVNLFYMCFTCTGNTLFNLMWCKMDLQIQIVMNKYCYSNYIDFTTISRPTKSYNNLHCLHPVAYLARTILAYM